MSLNEPMLNMVEIGRSAVTYSIIFNRMNRGDVRKPDLGRVVQLGEDFERLRKGERCRFSQDLLKGSQGLGVALDVEKRLLAGTGEKYQGLRELGIKSLDRLGKILRCAYLPGFSKYIPHLALLFDEWHASTEGILAERHPYYDAPRTSLDEAMAA
jgi:hypothetical protein